MLHSPSSLPASLAAPSLLPSLITLHLPDCLILEGPGLCPCVCLHPLNHPPVTGLVLFVCWLPRKLISLAQGFYLTLHPYTQLPIELTPGMSGSIANQRTKSKLLSFLLPTHPQISPTSVREHPTLRVSELQTMASFQIPLPQIVREHQGANPAGSPFKIHPESDRCHHLLCCCPARSCLYHRLLYCKDTHLFIVILSPLEYKFRRARTFSILFILTSLHREQCWHIIGN